MDSRTHDSWSGPSRPRSLAAAIVRHPGRFVAAALLLAVLAAWPTSQLRLETDLVALLPEGSPAAEGYRVYLERFGGFEKVFVLAELPQGTGTPAERRLLTRAARLLARELEQSAEVASVRSGMRPEDQRFFLTSIAPRAPLLLTGSWREKVASRLEPEAVRARARQLAAEAKSPAGLLTAPLRRVDPLGFSEDLATGPRKETGGLNPFAPAFLSADGTAAVVVLTPARAEIDPEGGRALAEALEAAYAVVWAELSPLDEAAGTSSVCGELVPSGEVAGTSLEVSRNGGLRFLAVGGPLYAAQDEELLREDLRRTIAGSALACAVVLVAAFEGVLLPFAALASLAVALMWTAGAVAVARGSVTAVGIGFAAVLIGLGIDYGIHGGVRLRQLRLEGRSAAAALAETFRSTGPGILTSALTTAAAFAVLALAHFRPLRELGLVVALGMLAILVASATMGAALASRSRPRGGPGLLWRLLGSLVEALAGLGGRWPKTVLAAAVAVTAIAAWAASDLRLDPDLRALRPADHPAQEAESVLSAKLDVGLETATLVVPGASLGEALEHSRAVREKLGAALGPEADLTAPSDWLAEGPLAASRLADLAELPFGRAAGQLEAQLADAGVEPRRYVRGLEALRAFGRGEDPGAPAAGDWPDWLTELVRFAGAEDGASRPAWAAVRLRLPLDHWPEGPPPRLIATLAEAAPGSSFASAAAVGRELRGLANQDLARLGGAALAVVAAVVLASFRGRPGPALLAGLPVLLGSLWSLGLWAGLGRPLDLLSLTVLPILLGIGIDDGLHALHGTARGRSLALSVRESGRAMVLTTLTTCAGFGSLTLSRVPGLAHGGLLVSLGVVACLLATLAVLPALEAVRGGTATHRAERR